jgi:hypothetical protein
MMTKKVSKIRPWRIISCRKWAWRTRRSIPIRIVFRNSRRVMVVVEAVVVLSVGTVEERRTDW